MSKNNEGKIIKVSGPLVVADGMEGASIYEVVKVGKEGLAGEIIEMREGEASIQVYEETAGVGPGEPVERTGKQLSVILGPGLLSSIYDGIQRPLDVIAKKTGDFIPRGVEVPSLDMEKSWDFKPEVKKGDEVEAGSVIGSVEETETITHKIMIPPTVEKGTVTSIEKGSLKITDTVAKVKTDDGEVEIKMLQEWPIRSPRPVDEKLLPKKPLVTGQRVIDTFFPVAKGGAASVPGPFGSGKCVDGNTKVLIGNGRIVSMKDIFEESKKKGKPLQGEESEEIFDIEDLGNPSVVSLKEGGFSSCDPVTAYKGKTDSMIRVKTATGKSLKVTPVHKLLVMKDGKVEKKKAEDIQEGDYLVSPRKVNLELEDQVIEYEGIFENTDKLFVADEETNKEITLELKKMREELSEHHKQYLRDSRKIPVELMFLVNENPEDDFRPEKICSYHGKAITLPRKITPRISGIFSVFDS